ncbi:hypothetical protein [Corynebacterium sp. Marseille-P4321]|uniref:hypothetical protein n=1 Tax=Corynebacterium sp. Marseille-P4321 TaxID=2736603 RepID=UPI00158CB1B3|nr:hypothetical protein [Corynebacterium sp. Marseille-P4321]
MKCVSAAVAVVASSVLLVSCSSEPEPLSEPSFTAEQAPDTSAEVSESAPADGKAAFTFEKREVELGPVDIDLAVENPFNVCTDLTEDEWDKLGFELDEDESTASVFICGLAPKRNNPDGSYLAGAITGGAKDLEGFEKEIGVEEVENVPKSKVPGLRYYSLEEDREVGCVALAETTHGTIMMAAGEISGADIDRHCKVAAGMMDDLYKLGK